MSERRENQKDKLNGICDEEKKERSSLWIFLSECKIDLLLSLDAIGCVFFSIDDFQVCFFLVKS